MAVRLAALLSALVLAGRSARAQESTLVLTNTQVLQAAGLGFGFGLQELQFGSRCFGGGGQNNGKGLFVRLTSEALNGYAKSICRYTGFEGKTLQNGWKVSAATRATTCEYNDFGTWRTLDGRHCVFNVLNTPAVNSTSAFFKVDATLFGQALQDRRSKLTWSITLRGPAGTSPWTAQAPTAPGLALPADNAELAGAGSFSWTAPATGAAQYMLCISRESYTGACEERARTNGTSAANVVLPFRGERIRWYVQACNSIGCTRSATSRLIRNRLPAATLVSPAANATLATRRPTFQWQTVPGAQTYTLYVYHANPLQEFTVPSLSANVTSFTPASDLTLDNQMYWMVKACSTATGCGTPVDGSQLHALNLPPRVLFATLWPTFQHARCRNCHAGTATNFVAGSNPGLPAGHTAASATTNCQACHTDALLPAQGTINPHWHSPPAAMNFATRTDQQICADIKANDPGPELATHLKEDKLVLWAVGGGQVPGNTTLALAPPNSIAAWRTLVDNWVNGGMHCN